MPLSNKIELPLYKTFTALMALEKNEEHNGIDAKAYLLLTDTIQKGYCLNNFGELLFLCEKLWLKPFHLMPHPVNKNVLLNLLKENLKVYSIELADEKKNIDNKEKSGKKNTDGKKNQVGSVVSAAPAKETFLLNTHDLKQPQTELYLMIADDHGTAGSQMGRQEVSDIFINKNYFLNYKHLPVSPRFLEQTFRSLRYSTKGKGKKNIDLESSIQQIAKQGYFTNWQYKEDDSFITKWTLFIDHDGSMIAFDDLIKVVINAAFNGSMINEGEVYYYKNYPANYLYSNEQHTRSVPFSDFANGNRKNILIISDAGAARGWFSQERVLRTFTMLYKLRYHRIAWLNPMPKQRWRNSSAEKIAQLVNMFELGNDNSDGLGNIVRSLKSKII